MHTSLRNITWTNFETVNANPREAFEDMSRMLFKKKFLDENTILNSKHNHPGIEVYPVLNKNGDKKISFQAKFFSASVDYGQIKHSAEQTVKYYTGSLDIFYLFCNKDLDSDSKGFKDIQSLLSKAGITIVLLTNKEILESVVDFPIIATKFFNTNFLEVEWFRVKLEESLDSMGERYNKLFNVSTQTEESFQLFLKNEKAVNLIEERKNAAIKELDSLWFRLSEHGSLIKEIQNRICSLHIDNANQSEQCLTWERDIIKAFKNELECLEKDLTDLEAAKLMNNQEEQKIWRKKRDLESLINFPDLLHFSQIDTNLLTNRAVLINGESGNGKTQLLSESANEIVSRNGHAILLSGHHFLTSDSLSNQIMEILGLDFPFSELLSILESIGEFSEEPVYIFIDAINESNNKEIWHVGLPKLINEIEKLNFVRLAVSFRSGYESLVIDDSLNKRIKCNQLSSITHYGFQDNSIEAIGKFLYYYGIPFSPTYILDFRMTNPLFLSMFCKVYDGNDFDFYELLNKFLKYADKEAQKAIGFDGSTPLLNFLVDEIANYQITRHKYSISQNEIIKLAFWSDYGIVDKKIPYLSSLKRSGVLLTFINSGIEEYRFGYNSLEDFIYARSIMDSHDSKDTLKDYLKMELLGIEGSSVKNKQYIDTYIVITSLYRQKFGEECIEVFSQLKEGHDKDMLQNEYMKSFSWRPAIICNNKFFREKANEFHLGVKDFFEILIENSVKTNHELNAEFLHHFLMKMSLTDRDYYWTIFINGNSDDGQRIIQLIRFIETGLAYGSSMDSEQSWLLAILLGWHLTSSNRFLRDRGSKSLIEILKTNFAYCQKLLEKFETVNDPYVIQRLYGVVFGACMKSNDIDKLQYKSLVEYVYSTIFDQETVFPDILLRDYARLIIERFVFKYPDEVNIVDYDKIKPPYKSKEIPNKKFEKNINWEGGMRKIESSLAPEGSKLMYGDFGRYVFQSALKYFSDVNIEKIYQYALFFIENDLGYRNDLFTEYDQRVNHFSYSRHDHVKVERIGKKYQWIAMYNILARISDSYELKRFWADSDRYGGPWNPYVRDFDPTLNENFLKPGDLPQFEAENNEIDHFISPDSDNAKIEEWISSNDPEFANLNSRLLLKDSDEKEWVVLYRYNQIESEEEMLERQSTEFKYGSQRIWTIAQGYFVNSADIDKLLEHLTDKNFYGRWFPESADCIYCLFNREFGWAPGYLETLGDSWLDYEVETGNYKTELIPSMVIKISGDKDNNEVIIEAEEEISVPEEKLLAKVLPAVDRFLWEEQYDASKNDSIAFYVPCSMLLKELNLEQKEYDGYFYSPENELVAFDRELTEKISELVIRKDYLEEFLFENNLSLFWTCLGEKQLFKGRPEKQKYREWSGVFHYSEKSIIGNMKGWDSR